MAWLSLAAMVTPCGLLAAIFLASGGAATWTLIVTGVVWLVVVAAMWTVRASHPGWTLLGPILFSATAWLLATLS